MDNSFDIMLNPEKFGYMQCPNCNGYGSSFKDPKGLNICTRCGDSGLIKRSMKSLQIDNFLLVN